MPRAGKLIGKLPHIEFDRIKARAFVDGSDRALAVDGRWNAFLLPPMLSLPGTCQQ
jgi:hypothetical protein